MPRIIYKPAARAKIIAAVSAARKSGKTWKDTLEAAKEAGYEGNIASNLIKLIGPKKAKKRGSSAKAAPAPMRGRPKKAIPAPVAARRPGRPRMAAVQPVASGSMAGIQIAIDAVVRQRVIGLITQLRTALDQAESHL